MSSTTPIIITDDGNVVQHQQQHQQQQGAGEMDKKENLIAQIVQLNSMNQTAQATISQLEKDLHNLKANQVEQEKLIEAEEEFITNTLFKRLEELSSEKNSLVLEVEREEEYLTNTLQKKMQRIQQDKIELENKLEIEEEAIVNRLQKQLNDLKDEKDELEHRVADTPRGTELRKLRWEFEMLKRAKENEISRISSENFGLEQQIIKYKEQYATLSTEKKELESLCTTVD